MPDKPPGAAATLFDKVLPPGVSPSVLEKAIPAAIAATATSVTRVVPSTPAMPAIMLGSLVGRAAVLVFGGFLLSWGLDISAWTGDDWVTIMGAVTILGGGFWSWLDKRIRARREHQIALASAVASAQATAAAGRPVELPVQPPPAKV